MWLLCEKLNSMRKERYQRIYQNQNRMLRKSKRAKKKIPIHTIHRGCKESRENSSLFGILKIVKKERWREQEWNAFAFIPLWTCHRQHLQQSQLCVCVCVRSTLFYVHPNDNCKLASRAPKTLVQSNTPNGTNHRKQSKNWRLVRYESFSFRRRRKRKLKKNSWFDQETKNSFSQCTWIQWKQFFFPFTPTVKPQRRYKAINKFQVSDILFFCFCFMVQQSYTVYTVWF